MNLKSLSLAAFVAVGAGQVALAQQSIVIPDGSIFTGAPGDPGNSVITATVGSTYVLAPVLNISACVIVSGGVGSWGSETRLQIANDAFPSLFATTAAIGSGFTFTTQSIPAGTRALSGALLGNALPSGSTTLVELWDSFDDPGDDASVNGLTVSTTGVPPVVNSMTAAGPWPSVDTAGTPVNSVVNVTVPSPAFVMGSTMVFSGTFNITNTVTWASDVIVRIRRAAMPSLYADFRPFTGTTSSETVIAAPRPMAGGLIGTSITPGSQLSFELWESFEDGLGAEEGNLTDMTFGFTAGSLYVPVTPPTAVDLGTLSNVTSPITSSTGTSTAVAWYKFSVGNVSSSSSHWLDIFTSSGAGGSTDSVVGLFNASGQLVDVDDDDDTGLLSMLTYGAGVNPANGTGLPFNGRDGANFAGGTYYVGVMQWVSGFTAANGFNMAGGTMVTNAFNLNLRTNVPPALQVVSGNMILQDTLNPFAGARSIGYAVKQGTTTVATGTVSASTPTTSYSITLPSSLSGAATIEWDGASFLLRKTAVNLTGANQSGINASLQNGDSDNSGEVDAADIDLVIADFGGTGITTDVDASGEVDAADIDIVIANFGGFND